MYLMIGFASDYGRECKQERQLSRVKQITSPGWMHETSAQGRCTGKTQRDGMGREAGGGDRNGEHM